MQLIFLAYFIPIIGMLLIALLVYLRQRNVSTYWFVAIFGVVALWLLLQMLGSITDSPLAALWLLRVADSLSNFLSFTIILFAYYFTRPHNKLGAVRKWTLTVATIAFALVSLTAPVIERVTPFASPYGPAIYTGVLYPLQTLFLVLGLIGGLLVLLLAIRRVSRAQRTAIYFISVAFAIPIITNFLVGYVFISSPGLQLLGPLSFLIMEALMGYAIVRHGLFNVRAFVIRVVTYVLLLAGLSTFYILVVFDLGTSVFDRLGIGQYVKLLYVATTLIVAISAQPLKRLFDRLTNKIFYQDLYDSQELLDHFSALVVSSIEQPRLLEGTLQLLKGSIRPVSADVLLVENGKRTFHDHGHMNSPEYDELYDFLTKRHTAIVSRDELDEATYSRKMLHLLDRAGISMVVRIQTTKELLGFLLLGPKRSGSMYTNQDTTVLRVITEELAVALQNARRFDQIQNFNATLQQRVEDATAKLRETNKKLRALDEVKDEFISMASHQLRTPLTAVKGYISMVLDGDGGPLKPPQRKLLGEAFTSTQRMTYLIADFLNVSRIHTGKFVIEPKPVVLSELIKGEINQLQATAKNRGLTLLYHTPSSFPTLMLDEDKTRQVIMNFIDNAIYYTPAGGTIRVELTATDKEARLIVQDTGIGVPKSERHQLFTKFFRASNARRMRPDGTGIGLYLARKVIVGQGGAIIFTSDVGKGSTFGFSFPLHGESSNKSID